MRNLRLTLLGLAAIAALFLGAGFLERAFRGDDTIAAVPVATAPPVPVSTVTLPVSPPAKTAMAPALKDARQKIDTAIATVPDYVRFFDRLRLVFPSEYDAILDKLAKGVMNSKKQPAPDAILADAVSALRKSNGAFAAKAQDDALAQIFVMQLKEMQALGERDAHLCVAFLFGIDGAGFLDFAAAHRSLVADAAISGLEAMNSGRQSPTQRGVPGDEDFQILDKALTDKGLSRPEIETLLDGKAADPPIPDERMCAAGQTYLQTLDGLEPAARGRLYSLAVGLMAKS